MADIARRRLKCLLKLFSVALADARKAGVLQMNRKMFRHRRP